MALAAPTAAVATQPAVPPAGSSHAVLREPSTTTELPHALPQALPQALPAKLSAGQPSELRSELRSELPPLPALVTRQDLYRRSYESLIDQVLELQQALHLYAHAAQTSRGDGPRDRAEGGLAPGWDTIEDAADTIATAMPTVLSEGAESTLEVSQPAEGAAATVVDSAKAKKKKKKKTSATGSPSEAGDDGGG